MSFASGESAETCKLLCDYGDGSASPSPVIAMAFTFHWRQVRDTVSGPSSTTLSTMRDELRRQLRWSWLSNHFPFTTRCLRQLQPSRCALLFKVGTLQGWQARLASHAVNALRTWPAHCHGRRRRPHQHPPPDHPAPKHHRESNQRHRGPRRRQEMRFRNQLEALKNQEMGPSRFNHAPLQGLAMAHHHLRLRRLHRKSCVPRIELGSW